MLRDAAGLSELQPLFRGPRAARRARAAADEPADAQRLALVQSVTAEDDDLSGLVLATVAGEAVSDAMLRTIAASPGVEFAEPLPVRWMARPDRADPMQNMQWALRAIRWFEAQLPPPEAPVSIAVLDTGIDRHHPDLRDIDVSYDTSGASTTDIVGHGTHVAGIIGATANNGIGITGVAPCRLAVWKVFGDEPADDGEYYVDAVRYYRALRAVADAGVSTMNLSIGGDQLARTEELLMARLARRGVTACAAMGNDYDYGDPVQYPAAFESVIAIGAVAEDRRRSSFSCTGKHIDLVAPGSHILSTVPTRKSVARAECGYVAWNGTSMAAPHVTAAAALVAAANPSWGPADVAKHLRATAAKLPAMRGRDWTREYGSGLLDLKAALT